MRGHLTKRGENSWTIVVDVGRDPATGKRRQQWVSVKGTKRDAEKRLAEILTELDKSGYVKPTKLTVGDFLERWLTDYVRPNVAPLTAEGYEHIVRKHLTPTLGNIPLAQLAPDHLQHY
ncbi:MAG: Arm DNA-binding domain-containing protein [Chloroflexota bacterium]|nr:Arm DNA-binding domain-containing protein [Chloroflexota bacterium]